MALRVYFVLCVFLPLPITAAAEFSLEAHVFSEVVDRGRSLTDGGAAVGASLSYDASSGWFAGGGGFYSDESPWGAPRTRNWNAFIGWFGELANGRALELSASRNQFRDVDGWDYTELRGNYHLNPELSVSLAWSPDDYGRDADHVIVAGNWRPELSEHVYLLLAGGAGYLSGPWDTDTYYAEAGIGVRAGRFDVSLTFGAVDDDAQRIFLTDSSTLALRLSYHVH